MIINNDILAQRCSLIEQSKFRCYYLNIKIS